MNQRYLITGCSGGGKSTLIHRLEALGHAVVHEPGLRVIREAGPAPWEDRPGFFKAVTAMARADLDTPVKDDAPTFFDRGLLDALSGRAARDKVPVSDLMPRPFPYAQPVFYAPPWPEIYEETDERRHSYAMALDEALRLRRDLDALQCEVVELPKLSVEERVHLVLDHALGRSARSV